VYEILPHVFLLCFPGDVLAAARASNPMIV
jgi:hypothetical protein